MKLPRGPLRYCCECGLHAPTCYEFRTDILRTNSQNKSLDLAQFEAKIPVHKSMRPRGGPYAKTQTVPGPQPSGCFSVVLRTGVLRTNSDCAARKQPAESAKHQQHDFGNPEARRLSHTYIKPEAIRLPPGDCQRRNSGLGAGPERLNFRSITGSRSITSARTITGPDAIRIGRATGSRKREASPTSVGHQRARRLPPN